MIIAALVGDYLVLLQVYVALCTVIQEIKSLRSIYKKILNENHNNFSRLGYYNNCRFSWQLFNFIAGGLLCHSS